MTATTSLTHRGNLPNENILCIDMKSFYASVEAVERGLDPLKVPLVVVGDKKRKGAVVLAASPMMKKKYNITTADRLYQIPDIPNKLWPLSLKDCWGIGNRLVEKLNKVGLQTLGDVAHFSLEYLENKFGIMGNQLYYHAWGVDLSKVEGHYLDKSKSIGRGITLYEDYCKIETIKTVIFDLSEVVAKRARENKVAGKTISLGLGYSRNESNKGFNR